MLFKQKRFSDTGNQSDNLSKVQGELDELKGIMVKNIGECLFFLFFPLKKLVFFHGTSLIHFHLFFLHTGTLQWKTAENH